MHRLLCFHTTVFTSSAPFSNGNALSPRRMRRPPVRRPICAVSTGTEVSRNRLGTSDLVVSEVCLGTMTWGLQNTEAEAHAQLDYAILERGLDFIDTAEMYPVPPNHPDQLPGLTETYIGNWLAKHRGVRENLVIASKVAGFSRSSNIAAQRTVPPVAGPPFPPSRLDRANIVAACDGSLRRLQTDYIDLYQLHWPDRYMSTFGAREYRIARERDAIPIRETLLALKELLESGKIRAYGLSNESTFGVCEFVRVADELGMPRPVTIQNQFCLLNRAFESELAEACAPRNFNIGLLPWSVLAGGMLSGKYLERFDANGQAVDASLSEARFVKFPGYMARFTNARSHHATKKYKEIAEQAGMSLATMAQAFCKTQWYIPSTIIGATSNEQLKENIDAFSVELDDEVLKKIDEVHNSNLDPCLAVF